ncbi:hypothetical protein MNAN1_002857 [Malassezia nana]|uniref:Uncharacterized protein n=1 Tax=Malassezia nana TaxID=180528 RepID=A0AAF0EN59_9BASI|nr:hypothetical protein MNAN1_002857 [Malassezia nana]
MQVDPNNRIATVVASHALHAAILRDSEALRSNYPGIERFKIASKENAATWFDATLILQPLEDGHVLTYDPIKHTFVPVNAALDDYLCHGDGRVEVPGVFVYMNAMLVDRLEAEFVPAPFGGLRCEPHLRRPAGSVDVVVIRPYRNPRMRKLLHEGENTKAMHDEYAQDVVQRVIFEGMYKGGSHVHFTYTSNGQVDTEGHAGGPKVVEYFRVSGYEWIASADDSQAHATCVDGTITEDVRTRTTISPIQGVKLWCPN